jgi:hypothetical protein
MNIQSLSICVPGYCYNNCKFCISKINKISFKNNIYPKQKFGVRDYINRLNFAKNEGVNTVVLTGSDVDPINNIDFLKKLSQMNKEYKNSPHFLNIELQTSGIDLLQGSILEFLRDIVGVNTISLSLSSIFNNKKNAEYNCTPLDKIVDIEKTCRAIKILGFNLRLSLNMTDVYSCKWLFLAAKIKEILVRAQYLQADQITFRKLYYTDKDIFQNKWIKQHQFKLVDIKSIDFAWKELYNYIQKIGKLIYVLPFGAKKYSINGISTVIDDDCMATNIDNKNIKYFILRPDCHLYSKWDDKGSLIF